MVSCAWMVDFPLHGVWGKVENPGFPTAVKNKTPASMQYYSEYATATRHASKIWPPLSMLPAHGVLGDGWILGGSGEWEPGTLIEKLA